MYDYMFNYSVCYYVYTNIGMNWTKNCKIVSDHGADNYCLGYIFNPGVLLSLDSMV